MSKVSYEPFENGQCIQVFVEDYFAGTLIKTAFPNQPEPEGRFYIGPWQFDGSDCQKMLGWPEIREVASKVEQLNTHWNWTLKNELEAAGRQNSSEDDVPVQGKV